MGDSTNWTPFPDDNLLGISDKDLINEYEAKGIAKAELYILDLDTEVQISTKLILDIHKVAFEELYDWAGHWRKIDVIVGTLIPPSPNQILQLMYQFVDTLNYKVSISNDFDLKVESLLFAHYEFIKIHPFNNGNGRTGRLLMNLIALKFGFKPLDLYHREGESRELYIKSMKEADKGNNQLLRTLISQELTTF